MKFEVASAWVVGVALLGIFHSESAMSKTEAGPSKSAYSDSESAGTRDVMMMAQLSHVEDQKRRRTEFTSRSPVLREGSLIRRAASSIEPSFEDLRAAIRDMDVCTSAAAKLDKLRLAWPRSEAPKYTFQGARNVLILHGSNRPDFSANERSQLSSFYAYEIVEGALLSDEAVRRTVDTCLDRFDDLRPMFASYSIAPSRRIQCRKAFSESQFNRLKENRGASEFELFAVFPPFPATGEVIVRPRQVRMEFLVLLPRTIQSQTGRIETGEKYWETIALNGNCPTTDGQ